jgi:phosphoribosylformylglycinamidine cyclo-ligase
MVVCVAASAQQQALQILRAQGEAPFVLGRIEPLAAGAEQVALLGLDPHAGN